MPRYRVKFKRELELSVEVEARSESRAESEAETQLATVNPGEWEEIDTVIKDVECLDEDEPKDEDEETE